MPTTERYIKKQPNPEFTYGGRPVRHESVTIEVFGYNHEKTADDLHKVLTESGFFEKHPCFSVRVETMDSYKPTNTITQWETTLKN